MANIRAASLPLFPELLPHPASGIARMAAAAPAVDQGHLVEFRSLAVRSILNRAVSRRGLRFAWSINPYRGCEFACRYCYARYTHEFMELRRPEDFEQQIFVKDNAAWLLRQELRRGAVQARRSRLAQQPIPISRSSDASASPRACWRCWLNSADCRSVSSRNRR